LLLSIFIGIIKNVSIDVIALVLDSIFGKFTDLEAEETDK